VAARRGAARNRAEYLLAEGVTRLVGALPERLVRRGLGRVAVVIRWLAGRRSAHTLGRVRHALGLPDGDARAERILRGAYEVLLVNVFEQDLVERRLARGARPDEFVTVEGAEHLQAALAGPHGVLLCSGHLGAWELIPLFMARRFTPIWTVVRELDNPLLERSLMGRRLRCTRGHVPKEGGGLKLARLMKAGEHVAMLLDQNAGSQGVILPFLGMPSSHHNVAGVLAQRFGAVVVPVYMLREEDGRRFRFVVEPPLRADPALPPEQAAVDVTRRLSASLQAMVTRHPEQWLWLHDRWRHALHVQRAAGGAAAPTQVTVAQGTNGP
jgi:KDO2-lipid IV(A) lauroyltransferase